MAFRGVETNIELAKYGLVGSRNLAAIPVTALLQARDISLDTGSLTRAGGARSYNGGVGGGLLAMESGGTDTYLLEDGSGGYLLEGGVPLTGSIIMLRDWFPTSELQRLIAGIKHSSGTKCQLWRDPAGLGVFVLAKDNLNVNSLFVPAEGGSEIIGNNRKLFITTGLDQVQVFAGDAATTRDINTGASGKPDDWTGTTQPRSLIFHNGRMWGILNHILYGSTVTDHENFKGAGSVVIPVQTGEGSYLQGGISFKGRLFLFKWPAGIYWLDDSSSTQANWLIKRLTKSTGLAGPNALVQVDDDVLFLSEIGHIHILSGIQDFGDVQNSDLSALNELTSYVRDNIDTSRSALERAWAIYYPEKKQARFGMRSLGSSFNDIQFVVDMNRKNTPRIHLEDITECGALALRQDTNRVERPISGDSNGVVWLLDQDDTNKDGAGYATIFQLPHTDFAWFHEKLGSVNKNYAYLEAIMQPAGNFTLSFDAYYDGVFRTTVTMNTGESGSALGSFVLGQDALGGESLLSTRKRLRGSSRRLSLVGRQSGPNEKFTLSQLSIGLVPGSA